MPLNQIDPVQLLSAMALFRKFYDAAKQEALNQNWQSQQMAALTTIPFSNLPASSKLPPIQGSIYQAPLLPPRGARGGEQPSRGAGQPSGYIPEERPQPRPSMAVPGSAGGQSSLSRYHRIPLGRGKVTGVSEGLVGDRMNIQHGMQVLRPQRSLPQKYPEQRAR